MAGPHRWRVVHLPVTASTQADVERLAEQDVPSGAVVRAHRQTRGTGRGHRAWASPQGGLWFSLLARPDRDDRGLVPLVAGSAVAEAVRARAVDARVKWPNDVLVDDRKLAGVLVDGRTGTDPRMIVGVGLNANVPLDALPEDARAGATSLLAELGHPVDLDRLFRDLLDEMGARLDRWSSGRDDVLREEANRLSWSRGRTVTLQDTVEEGEVVGVDEDGALLVRTVADTRRVTDPDLVDWHR